MGLFGTGERLERVESGALMSITLSERPAPHLLEHNPNRYEFAVGSGF
jgi:hypothetical protein